MNSPQSSFQLPIITPDEPLARAEQARLPRWLKRNIPKGNADHFTQKLIEELKLETVAVAAAPSLSREDARRLQAALHELSECRRLIEDALRNEAA